MRAAARKLAVALQAQARERERARGRATYRAAITRWKGTDDFAADLIGEDLDVDEDDVTFGRALARELDDEQPDVGDVLVLVEVGEHEFIAVAVED